MSEHSLIDRLRAMGATGWNPIGNEAAKRIEELEEALEEMLDLCHYSRDPWQWGSEEEGIFNQSRATLAGADFKETTSG